MNITIKDFQFAFIGILLLVIALLFPISIVGSIVAVLLAIYSFLTPKNGLLTLLIYFPVRPFLIEINPALKLVGDLVIIAAFLRVVFDLARNKEWKDIFRFQFFEWAFIAFCVLGAVSALITDVSIAAIITQLRAFVITFLAFYTVKRLDITKEDILKFLWITFAMAILLCIHGIIEKFTQRRFVIPESWVMRPLSEGNRARIFGLIDNPNVLSVYLTIAGMLTFYLKSFVRGKIHWVLNIGIILMFGVMTLTYSRGTAIGLAVALVVYVLLTRQWKRFVIAAVVLALSFAVVNIPISQAVKAVKSHSSYIPPAGPDEEENATKYRLSNTFDLSTIELSKKTGRLFVVDKGFEVFKDHPIIGTGFATFGDSASRVYSSPIYEEYDIGFNIYSDNQYIQIIAQTGVVGVILFAAFLLGMLVYLWRNRHDSPFVAPLIALLLGVYVCGVLYNIWEDKTFTLYFFLMLGACASLLRTKNRIN